MSRLVSRSVAVTIAALVLAAGVGNAQTINLPSNDLPTGPFGKSSTATYGQTFTAPTSFNYLQKFSFWLSNDGSSGAVNPLSLRFRAYVMQWDAINIHATGPVLYASATQSGPSAFSQRYDFAAPNTLLNASFQYVAFLSASGLFGTIGATEATAVMEASLADVYTGGQFVFAESGDSFASLSSDEWMLSGYQTHFGANFTAAAVSVVPEPSSLVLLVTGVSALLVVAARKRRV